MRIVLKMMQESILTTRWCLCIKTGAKRYDGDPRETEGYFLRDHRTLVCSLSCQLTNKKCLTKFFIAIRI